MSNSFAIVPINTHPLILGYETLRVYKQANEYFVGEETGYSYSTMGHHRAYNRVRAIILDNHLRVLNYKLVIRPKYIESILPYNLELINPHITNIINMTTMLAYNCHPIINNVNFHNGLYRKIRKNTDKLVVAYEMLKIGQHKTDSEIAKLTSHSKDTVRIWSSISSKIKGNHAILNDHLMALGYELVIRHITDNIMPDDISGLPKLNKETNKYHIYIKDILQNNLRPSTI